VRGRIAAAAAEVPRMAFAANVDRALLLRRQALKKAEGRRRLALLCLACVYTTYAQTGFQNQSSTAVPVSTTIASSATESTSALGQRYVVRSKSVMACS